MFRCDDGEFDPDDGGVLLPELDEHDIGDDWEDDDDDDYEDENDD